MKTLTLLFDDGAKLAVPASLRCITTYVLLEQEVWFEKECRFVSSWLKPGMTVIDIGANLGVYAIPAARRVGTKGRIFAYEPASETRNFLEQSRSINELSNLEILGAALSDSPRDGHLFHGTSGELHSLSGTGSGEAVSIASLDAEAERHAWTKIDFVKIDAEGEETRIAKGGSQFFAAHSPLVMFEIKAGDNVNLELVSAFSALGYRIFRAIAGASLLIPFDTQAPLDVFELNLFAAKADRATDLARDGFLIETVPDWTPDEAARSAALEVPMSLPFASGFAPLFAEDALQSKVYRDCLGALAVWNAAERPLAERYAALLFAQRKLLALAQREPSLARLSTLARASWDAGFRKEAVVALYQLADLLGQGDTSLSEPFWPANPRFDAIEPQGQMRDWFVAGAMEQLVRAERFSNLYGPPPIDLARLERSPFAAPEIARRRVLLALNSGRKMAVPEILRHRGKGHLNAEIWRVRKVPGL